MHENWEQLREARRVQQAIEDEFVRALRLIGREAALARQSTTAVYGQPEQSRRVA